MKSRTIPLLVAVVTASACTNFATTAPYKFEPRAQAQGASRGETPLYARDGSVVGGVGATNEVAPRELAPTENGRTYILELYQKAIDERDALRRELDATTAELVDARATLAQGAGHLDALQTRIAALEGESQRRLEENIELAARLVTAQIRRLQAEKVLLEARLAPSPTIAAQTAEQK